MEKTENVVAACAAMREAPGPEYTIVQAIDDAKWVRGTPDGILAPDAAKRTIVALLAALEASPCYFKGVRLGIPTFTILGYDRAGHIAIREWANAAQAHGCRMEKVTDARMRVVEWEMRLDCAWPT